MTENPDWVSARNFLSALSEDDRKTLYREACRATYTPELIEDAWSVKVFVPLEADVSAGRLASLLRRAYLTHHFGLKTALDVSRGLLSRGTEGLSFPICSRHMKELLELWVSQIDCLRSEIQVVLSHDSEMPEPFGGTYPGQDDCAPCPSVLPIEYAKQNGYDIVLSQMLSQLGISES